MSGRQLTMLVIPTQASSPNNQPTTPNGRPSTWSLSAQRKMARLYLYTTLPAEKIRAIINAHSPNRTIKQSSANKRLQSIFDKEPRWLHPHDEEDMGRRITELANSPTQLRVAWETQLPSAHRSRDQPPLFSRNDFLDSSFGAGSRPSSASPSDECSDSVHSSDAFSESQMSLSYVLPGIPEERPGENGESRDHFREVDRDDGPFIPFLQQTTFMTESSAKTTGTFRRHLQGYTEPYIKVVKRLVKRFTSPALDQPSTSPQHDMRVIPHEDWIGNQAEKDGSLEIDITLAGEFLRLDFEFRNAPVVAEAWRHWFKNTENHGHFYWVTPDGLTDYANTRLRFGLYGLDHVPRDCFQNTALHFLAACAPPQLFLRALVSGISSRMINAQNTAGQTFMHVLEISNGWTYQLVGDLVEVAQMRRFDMCARDCYGRSSFHILNQRRLPLLQSQFAHIDPREYLKRDAYGIIPVFTTEDSEQQQLGENALHLIPSPALDPRHSNNPEVSQESQLLQDIRMSLTDPYWEDQYGHNGLHCLAMATLSFDSLAEKYQLKEEAVRTRGPEGDRHPGDSSTEILQFRYSMLQSLLDAGLDPNHRDKFGNTPLMAFAAALPEDDGYKIGPAMLKLLISRGADVNARNRDGDTALHVAVSFHRKLAIRTLTEGGANVHVKNARDQSLLDICDDKLGKYGNPADYGKYSACRAWLSGQAGAVQSPSWLRQWVAEEPGF